MNAKVNRNTVSNKKFREILNLSNVKDPEGGNYVSAYVMDKIGSYELLATYDRRKNKLVEVELASIHEEVSYELTDHQMDVLYNYLFEKSNEFANKDANYMTSYDYAIKNGWSYGD